MAAGNDIVIPPVPDKPYEIKLTPDKSKPIAVTGANGFLGTHICEMLLKKGYNIKAGVLGEDKHTRNLDPDNSRITFFSIDLLKPETFDPLFSGVEFVIHTAAPVNNRDFKDAWKDLVEPGIKGITNVLNSCDRNGVKKIVVTSSTGAVADDPSKLFDENDWNQKSNVNRLPYWYSKAKSESTAWEWLSKHPNIQMVVLNPGVFIGPYHATHSIPESNRQILDLVTADICVENRFMVKYCYCLTDVRDVAEAHVKLLENPNVYGRYLCCEGSNMWVEDCSKMIVGMFPSFSKKVAKKVVDSNYYRVKFGKSPTALAIILYLDRTHDYNTRKIREELGMEFIDIPTSIYDLVLDMVYKKHLKVQPEEYDDFVRLREKRLEEIQQKGPEFPYLGSGRDLYFPIPTQYYVRARKWKGRFPEFERNGNDGKAEETNPEPEPEPETTQESIPEPVSVPQATTPAPTAPVTAPQPPPTTKKPNSVCWCW